MNQQNQSARARIHSRKPTGKVAWPLVLIEGEEKAGKTWLTYELSKSDRIGDAFAIDLGEGSADEYASIGRYEVLMPDPNNPLAPWTFVALLEQISAVRDYAREQLEAGKKPVLLTIDTMSDEWGVLVDAINAKAAKSDRNRKALAADSAAEVKIPNHLWNDANAKHKRLMTLLQTFPGIVVLTARGKEVAEIRNGQPVEGSKVWKVEAQKNLPYDVTLWVRMLRNGAPTLEGARSVRIGLRPGVDSARVLSAEFSDGGLEWLIFDQYGLDPATAQVRDLQAMTDDGEGLNAHQLPAQTVEEVLARVKAAWGSREGLLVMHREITARGYLQAIVQGPDDHEIGLGAMVVTRGRDLAARATASAAVETEPPAPVPENPEAAALAAAASASGEYQPTPDDVAAAEREDREMYREAVGN